jgi:hypothetical protein
VVDVGHCIELYSEFSCTGGIYRPFPDSISYRIPLRKLADADIREHLRHVWTDPLSLDPSRHHARVTRELAVKLADLAKSLEFSGHQPDRIGEFLMRCLFTFFAEDIGLIPEKSFSTLIEGLRGNTEMFPDTAKDVWQAMRDGSKSIALKRQLLHFNGGLFEKAEALRRTYPDVSESADYVMYWWHMAGQLAREEKIKRFGFITTNSLPMINNRKILQHHLSATPPLSVISPSSSPFPTTPGSIPPTARRCVSP